MAVNYNGRVLLNPYEKGTKYFDELQNGIHLTNNSLIKTDNHGKPMRLTDTQKAYRSGFLQAQKDARRAFMSKHPNYKPKKS